MRIVSQEFLDTMQRRPCIARIVLDGTDTIQGDPIQEIAFDSGANDDSDAISIGGVVAASVEIILDKTLVDVALTGRTMEISLGMELGDTIEWVEMGTYTAMEPAEDDGTITVTAMDKIGTDFDVEYEPIDGLDPESEDGVSAKAFVIAICGRHGVEADLSDLDDYTLKYFSPEGCTDRQLVGFVAALYGKFATIGRDGILRFGWYQNTGITITGDDYYEGGMEKSSYDFTVSWLKCYNEVLEETLTVGNPEEDQGIYFACPWMTQEILESLWEARVGFSYAPVSELSFFGDPRLEPGDMVQLETLDGKLYWCPVMTITHEFDGGLRTSISAVGQRKSDAYEGPVERETKRTVAKIMKTQKGIEMSVENAQSEISYLQMQAERIETRVEDTEGNISALEQKAEELEAKAEDAAGDIAALQVQADEIAGRVEDVEGDMTEVKQNAGQVSVSATDATGTLETKINPNEWTAQRTDKAGKVTSEFRFDFGTGMFVFDGTGKFMAPDGKSYITVDGGAFVLYAQDGEDGDFVDIARISFSEDSEGLDYPYILLGHAEESDANHDKIGLIKMFANGIYVGNSVPRLSTGDFVGLAGAVGFFVDVQNAKTYNVVGEDMYDSFVAVFA